MNPSTKIQPPSARPDDSSNQEQKKTFACVAAKDHKPQRDHAIIIEALQSTTIDEYLSALANITNPSKIKYISRIANARICVFLASKADADQITDNYRSIKVKNISTPIRPLISKQVRVVISNVCPVIPNSLIRNELSKYDITPSTSIINMRAAVTDKRFIHIMSFRRTFLIEPEQIHKLPDSVLIQCDDTNYRIYLSVDNENCYLCKKQGHYAKNCILGNNKHNNSKLTTILSPETEISIISSQQPQEIAYSKICNLGAQEKRPTHTKPTLNKANNEKDNLNLNYHDTTPSNNNKLEMSTPTEIETETSNSIEVVLPTPNEQETNSPSHSPSQDKIKDTKTQLDPDAFFPSINSTTKETNLAGKLYTKTAKQTGTTSPERKPTLTNTKEFTMPPKRQLSPTPSIKAFEAPKPDQPLMENPPKKNKQIKQIETSGPTSSKINPQLTAENTTTEQQLEQMTSTLNPKSTTSLPADYYENTIEALRISLENKPICTDLNFDQIKQLILECFATTDPGSVCRDFNVSLNECYNLADTIYCASKERYLKARIKRLMKKVDKLSEIEEAEERALLANRFETSD